MQVERRAQITLLILFIAISVAVVWSLVPPISLAIDSLSVRLDRIMLSGIAVVVSALLAAAFGNEAEIQRLVRLLPRATPQDRHNQQIMQGLRVVAIVFVLLPFVLLVVELSNAVQPLTFLSTYVDTRLPPSGAYVVALLYTSLFGLALTVLTIDFFFQPLTEARAKRVAHLTSVDLLREAVTRSSIEFLQTIQQEIEANIPIKGSGTIWQTALKGVEQFSYLHTEASVQTYEADKKMKMLPLITDLKESAREMMTFLEFLGYIHPSKPRSGANIFKWGFEADIDTVVAKFHNSLVGLHEVAELDFPTVDRAKFDMLCNDVAAGLKRLRVAGEAYYSA